MSWLWTTRRFPSINLRVFVTRKPIAVFESPRAQFSGTCGNGTMPKSSRPITLNLFHGRNYSTGNSSTSKQLTHMLNSRVSFRLANVVYAGLIGSVILYALRKRSKKRQDSASASISGGRISRFENRTVIITGGAGDIGMNTGLAFAREGAVVFLVDLPHTEKALKENCKELEKSGARLAEYVMCDVTENEDVRKMVKTVKDKVEHIDFFFNNAGVQGALRPVHKQDDTEFKKVINVNIYGVFLGLKYISEAMIESGRGGVIVNTASLAGLLGPANMAAYAASKFAVVGMTKTAAKDLATHGIRVCAIAPGILEGKMWGTQVRGNAKCRKELGGDESELTDDDISKQEVKMIEGTPMKRQGKLSEVASVVTFLCSDDASYLTGVTIPIDGGRLP